MKCKNVSKNFMGTFSTYNVYEQINYMAESYVEQLAFINN